MRGVRLVQQSGLAQSAADVAHIHFPNRAIHVVGDELTLKAFGSYWQHASKVHTLPYNLTATQDAVDEVIRLTATADVLVAVGSGTINDICKYASHLRHKPYVLCPTALSMNGYLSSTASIERDGLKQSFDAHLPASVLIDPAVLAAAPQDMSKAGVADVLCHATIEVDLLWTHYMAGQPLNSIGKTMLAGLKPSLNNQEDLLQAVLLSGLAMTLDGSSAPASQSEHQVVHTLHLLLGKNTPKRLHGLEIAVSSASIAAIQQNTQWPQRWPEALPARWLAVLPEVWRAKAQSIYAKKRAVYLANHQEIEDWQAIAKTPLKKVAALSEMLTNEGINTSAEAIGWPAESYELALKLAPWLRERFFVLDAWSVGQM